MKISIRNSVIGAGIQKAKVTVIRYWARKTADLPPICGLREYSAYNIRIGIYRAYPLDEPEDETERRATHFAAMHGDYQALRMLIWLGADLTLKDRPGLTPLEYALMHKHYRCVQLIARTMERCN